MREPAGYTYIWEYVVRPERAREFEAAYGPDGRWVHLFRRGRGYHRTELHRDRESANRYFTIDYWDSEEAWQDFRTTLAEEFDALDDECEGLTLEEREVVRLEPIG